MAVDYQVRLSELTPVELETPIGLFQGFRSDILKLTWPFLGPRPDDPNNALTFQMKSAQDTPESPYWTEAPYRSTIYLQTVQTVFDTGDRALANNWYLKQPLVSTPFDIGTEPPTDPPTQTEVRENFAKMIQQFTSSSYQGDTNIVGSGAFDFYGYSMFSGNNLFGSLFIDVPESVRNPLKITPLPGKYGEEWPWWSAMTSNERSLFSQVSAMLFSYSNDYNAYGRIGDCHWKVVKYTPGVSVDVVRLNNSVNKDSGNTYKGIITPIDKPLDFAWLIYKSYDGSVDYRPFGYYWGATRIWFGIEENTQEATT